MSSSDVAGIGVGGFRSISMDVYPLDEYKADHAVNPPVSSPIGAVLSHSVAERNTRGVGTSRCACVKERKGRRGPSQVDDAGS